MARENAADIAKLQKSHAKECQFGNVLYGEEVHGKVCVCDGELFQ